MDFTGLNNQAREKEQSFRATIDNTKRHLCANEQLPLIFIAFLEKLYLIMLIKSRLLHFTTTESCTVGLKILRPH